MALDYGVTVSSQTLLSLLGGHPPITKAATVLQDVGATAVLPQGQVMGKVTLSCPTTGTAAQGNTGGGTMTAVTADSKTEVGVYQAKCAEIGVTKTVPATGTAGSNTGNGTMGSVTGGANVEIGTYTITCDDVSLVTGATPASSAAWDHNTGNGVMGAVAVGATAKVGVYTLKIVAESSNAGAFNVYYPDGSYCGQGHVAAEFVGGGLTFTLADGSADFIIGDGFNLTVAEATSGAGSKWTVKTPSGEALASKPVTGSAFTSPHLNFTIADGSTNFIVGDSFTVAVTENTTGAGSLWNIKTPSGVRLSDQALTGTAYTSEHINFTINDSGTNFAVGDIFTVTVAAGSGKLVKWYEDAVNGVQNPVGILTEEISIASLVAGDVNTTIYVHGEFREDALTYNSTASAGEILAAVAAMQLLGIYAK